MQAGMPAHQDEHGFLDSVLAIAEDLIQIHDLSALLDKILSEARRFTRADAGSIFLVTGDHLQFSYVHNDTLFTSQNSHKYLYQDLTIPIDQTSLSGFVACTGQSLNIPDAYEIPPTVPYGFNRSFDQSSGYRTHSVLVVPMRTSRGKIVGVLQIINARDKHSRPAPFSEREQGYVTFFANNAAIAVERALITRELILRTARMAELRDPKETGAHVNRVGAYSAEIYERWARDHGLEDEFIKRQKDLIRVASMLHDVGKVAISDMILKKPGKLDDDEFAVMQYHTVYGAQLFKNSTSELDTASLEIALSHHERWDGKGYPGRIEDLFAPGLKRGPGKRAEEIPLFARIVALADVYDALICRRVYKPPWPEEKVLDEVRAGSGSHFDPEVVDAFFAIYDVIGSIRERYPDEE